MKAGLRSTGCREGRGRRSGSGGGSGSEATRTWQDGGLLVKGIYRSAGHAPLSMGHGLVGVCKLVRADVDEGERRSSLGGAGERRLGEQGSARRAAVRKRRVIHSGSGRIRLGERGGVRHHNGCAEELRSGLAVLPVLEGMPTLLTGTSHAHDADLSGTCELKGLKRGWRAGTDGSP
ncbi:hypothetical protein JB92DRAFT_2833055 [Gautieria morchelliformis]|nr:hypothetical protein JB92DRAFT_2833055 [Gautieria morchelliformis]